MCGQYKIEMIFEKKIIKGWLVKRYKRFLADVILEDGSVVTAHCTNSGSMKTCIEVGAPVLLSVNDDEKRKTKFTWEGIFINNHWIGVNTLHPNKIVFDALKEGLAGVMNKPSFIRREVVYGDSRFDIYVEHGDLKGFVEVKNVTMRFDGNASFPDAVSTRGRKHLETLMDVKSNGMRAVMFYFIQRADVHCFTVANHIDPDYAYALRLAMRKGVEVFAFVANVSESGITLGNQLPVDL